MACGGWQELRNDTVDRCLNWPDVRAKTTDSATSVTSVRDSFQGGMCVLLLVVNFVLYVCGPRGQHLAKVDKRVHFDITRVYGRCADAYQRTWQRLILLLNVGSSTLISAVSALRARLFTNWPKACVGMLTLTLTLTLSLLAWSYTTNVGDAPMLIPVCPRTIAMHGCSPVLF